MADRYDPKLSVRPGGTRRPAEPRRDEQTQDDPLAELAKLVSGRSPASSRARPPPASEPSTAGTGDVLGDLETELLNDLQASFAAVRDMVASPPPVSPANPVRTAVAPPATPAPFADDDPSDADPLPAGLAERLAPEPPPPLFPSSAADRAAPPEPAGGLDLPSAADPAAFWDERPAPPQPPPARASEDPDGFSTFQSRSSESRTADTSAATPHLPRSRWEPAPAKPASATVSRFAPPQSAAPPAKPAPFDNDDPFADLIGADDDEAPDEFPLEGFGDLKAEDEFDPTDPAYAGGDLAGMIEPRRSRTPLLVAGVVGLVLVGGIAVAMFRPAGGDAETPPVIVADGQPTRITPDETMLAEADAQNKLIYDRVNAGDEATETTLLTPADEPIAEVPADDSGNSAISRVIIPAGPGFDDPAADEGLSLDGQPSTMPADGETQVAASEEEPIEPIGPRRVRTVIVKPDGTIVESGASEVGDETPPVGQQAPAAAEPDPTPVVEAPPSAPVTDDTAAIAGTDGGELAITPVPDIGGETAAAAAEPPGLPTPSPTPAPAPPPAPAAVAAVDTNAPIDLQQSPSPPRGGMLVQVSSQRSEDAARATFRDLQARYPNILGSYDVNIQRAEIPDRGTFYRVRVGPFSASDAQRLCNDLKAAGGDCILAQR